MITTQKLSLYRKYEGQGDRFLVSAWPWQRHKISPDDWKMIEQLIQDIKLMDRGLASDSYKEGLLEKINANCEDKNNRTTKKISDRNVIPNLCRQSNGFFMSL
ncbi:MAG: hypothetical protein ACXWV9_04770 [Flavisolibacter sp.]